MRPLVTSQIQEMQSVRQNVYELQMAHEKMKQMYMLPLRSNLQD